MLEIKPRVLGLIRRLAQVRRPATPFDGHLSPRSHHRLEHAGGGCLIFHTSDNRIQVTSRIAASGEDSTWVRLLEPHGLDGLVHLEAGGSYSLSTTSPKCLSLQKGFHGTTPTEPIFRYPLFCRRTSDEQQPFDNQAVAVHWQPVNFNLLRRALMFLSPQGGNEEMTNSQNTISFLQDSRVVGYRERVHLQCRSIPVPFPVHLYTSDAARLLTWLRIVALDAKQQAKEDKVAKIDQPEMGEVGLHEADGHRFYLFRTQCGQHTLQVIGSLHPCQTGFQDRTIGTPVSLACVMKRKLIREVAAYFQVFRDHKLQFRVGPHVGDGLDVDLVKDEEHTPLGRLPFTSEEGDAPHVECGFLSAPRDLLKAVARHGNTRITLKLLRDQDVLVLESQQQLNAANPPLVFETIIRVRPLAAPLNGQDDAAAVLQPACTGNAPEALESE